MKLMDLRPQFRRVYKDFDPRTGGTPTDDYELSFACPACGPPCRVSIRIGATMDQALLRWQATPLPPDGADWPGRLTINPSVNWTTAGHGRHRPPCTWHGNIIDGEIHPPLSPPPASQSVDGGEGS